MVGFILDTSVLSETSKQRPHPAVIDFLANNEYLLVPVASLVEVHAGIVELCSHQPAKAIKLCEWYQTLFVAGLPILSTGREVAEMWATLMVDTRLRNLMIANPRAKKPRNGQDLHIAAASLATRLPIATLNIKDFSLIDSCYPLPGIYDPLREEWHTQHEPIQWPEPLTDRDRTLKVPTRWNDGLFETPRPTLAAHFYETRLLAAVRPSRGCGVSRGIAR